MIERIHILKECEQLIIVIKEKNSNSKEKAVENVSIYHDDMKSNIL
jgi:hypothetical protein